MAFAIDNGGHFSGGGKLNSRTDAYTVASNAMVIVDFNNNDNRIAGATCTINGVSMTPITNGGLGDGVDYSYLFYLYVPVGGTYNIVATLAGGLTGDLQTWVASFTGAGNNTIDASTAFATSSGTTVTNTITTVANNALHVAFMGNLGGNVMAAGTGTQGVTASFDASNTGFYVTSPFPVSPAGSNAISATFSPSASTFNAGASFSPAGATTVSNNLALLGVS